MNKQRTSINFAKMGIYILKRIWLVILCAAVGYGYMSWQSSQRVIYTYTATGTMFVTNSNPNLINYGYANSADFSSAVQLVNIYNEVVKSESVTQRILECRLDTVNENGEEQEILLGQKYPNLTPAYIRGVVSMASLNDTPMVRVSVTTTNPQMSADICNAVLEVAPAAIKDVVGAGDAKPQDYATVPTTPNIRNDRQKKISGALAGAAIAAGLLALLFLLNRRVEDTDELKESYTPPVLASVRRRKGNDKDPESFLLGEKNELDLGESYAKLRMNLLYTLVGKNRHTVIITSAVSGEGKSTIAANLAVSMASSGKHIILVDADMRRACQTDMFRYDSKALGLSDVLVGNTDLAGAVIPAVRENLDILPAGSLPPNPSELLESQAMKDTLAELEAQYDLVLLDAPPINIVSDPLALSSLAAGGLFVVRQHFSDHREIRKALIQAEMTGLELLGFVFYGEKIREGSYYSRRYYYRYKGYHYYHQYDTRSRAGNDSNPPQGNGKQKGGVKP